MIRLFAVYLKWPASSSSTRTAAARGCGYESGIRKNGRFGAALHAENNETNPLGRPLDQRVLCTNTAAGVRGPELIKISIAGLADAVLAEENCRIWVMCSRLPGS